MKRRCKRISYTDRKLIESRAKQGKSVIEIANEIGVHRMTIYSELKRGGSPYSADRAQKTL